MSLGDVERKTQNQVIQLFQDKLGYRYLGNWQDEERTIPVELELLQAFLVKKGYSNQLIGKALYEIEKAIGNRNDSLYETNKSIYSLLRYGIKLK